MNDISVLRELAKQYVHAANDPVNSRRRERAYAINGLKPVRPIVWIEEVPWGEFCGHEKLKCLCKDPVLRDIETWFRRKLFQWEYFQADMILEPFYPLYRSYESTGNGFEIIERIIKTDERNHIVSHEYVDQLDTEEKVRALRMPEFTLRADRDNEMLDRLNDIFGEILPVKLLGHHMYFSAWDRIAMLRGMTPLLTDLIAEKELMHLTAEKFYSALSHQTDFMNENRLFDSGAYALHCTPGYSKELEENEKRFGNTCKCAWLRVMAQPFASVSPAMHEEFDIRYLIPIAEKFGFVYYGCCEPLSDRLDIIKKIPNLRKIGVSPWSDIEVSAEQIGSDYVYARKPNPAFVVGTLDENAIRRETETTVKACIRHHCPLEFSLKDISSASGKIENLARWSEIVKSVLDKYY